MATERELVALLYRADWTRLSLSGVLHGADDSVISFFTETLSWSDALFPPFPPPGADWGADRTLLLAPGKRYREESADGRRIRGCDGEHVWEWFPELPPKTEARLVGGPQPPFPTLLAPSWLLGGYQLAIEGESTTCGRAGVRVVATRRGVRRGAGPGRLPSGGLPVPPFRWPPLSQYDRVSAVVDAELGILLSCECQRGDRAPEVIEFRSLTLDPEVDPARFTAPAGSVLGGGSPFGWPFGWPSGGIGREAAKTAAGLAAGGLGAAIKYSPRKRQDPFARATSEDDPEPEMPQDDPLPGSSGDVAGRPVSDEVLHLLYRGGTDVPGFTGTLHQWFGVPALLEAVPESARRTGFGGVGFLVDALRDAAREAGEGTGHVVRSVRMSGWDRYRIEGRDSGERRNRRHQELLTVACDGQRRWQVFTDRVVVGPAGPPPDELADLADGSWLLGCDLSGGEEIVAGGRRAFRVAVDGRDEPPSPLTMFYKLRFPAVAVVDAQTGRLLRLTLYKGGKPVLRSELRDIAPDESGDSGFEPPAGLRVVEESSEEDPSRESAEHGINPVGDMAKAAADAVRKRVDEKAAAARRFLDSFRRPT